jgi:mRNA interferase MazF
MGRRRMAMVAQRFDVYLVNLDPTVGSEIQKTRPCLVISPDEINRNIRTVIIAPMTSSLKNYPTRVSCTFRKKQGQIVLDQIRTIDKKRLIKKLGTIDSKAQLDTISILQRLFAY